MGKIVSNCYAVINGFCKKIIVALTTKGKFTIGSIFRLFRTSKLSIYGSGNGRFGNNVKITDFARIVCTKDAKLVIGDNVGIGEYSIVVCRNQISIGNGTMLGPSVYIYDHDHLFDSESGARRGEFSLGKVIIGNNCWIGANTVILKDTTIGDNCIIGAGSVIKGEIKPGTKVIQKRNTVFI